MAARRVGTDYYKLLEVSRNCTAVQLKAAYIVKARAWHPDAEGGDSRRFVEVNAAYDTLRDPTKRTRYDCDNKWTQPGYRAGPTVPRGGQWGSNPYDADMNMKQGHYPAGEFYRGDKPKFEDDGQFKSPYKIFSNMGVVGLAMAWMLTGIVVHIWRFSGAAIEARELAEQRSAAAAQVLHAARSAASSNTHTSQLADLRTRHSKDRQRAAEAGPAADDAPPTTAIASLITGALTTNVRGDRLVPAGSSAPGADAARLTTDELESLIVELEHAKQTTDVAPA